MSKKRAWMVRAGNDNKLVDQFEMQNWVAIGWPEMADLSSLNTREAVKERYAEVYEKHSRNKRAVNAGQLYRFSNVIGKGDLVLSYDKSSREYLVGEVDGPYQYQPSGSDDGYPHVRSIAWEENRIGRDRFSTPAKNTLGGTMSVFSLDEIIDEINEIALGGEEKQLDEEEEDQPPFHEEVESQSEELISDLIANLDGEEVEEITAALLRAMGFHANTTQSGADHGVDVEAHPDALGFEDPYVKVQVKHRESKIGSGDVRDFLGALGTNDKGLFVSTGGYTSSAIEEADRSHKRITLVDRDRFLELFLTHYSKIEPEYTNLIPLSQVYVPTKEP